MKILDLYILKKLLKAFFFVVILLVLVVVVINITERNDKFIENQLGFIEIAKYYLNYAPYIANMITPITVFIATVFITSQMAGHTEIIAMLSSGVSFTRLMIPYLIGSMIIAAISFGLGGWVIPNSNKHRIAFEVQYFKKPFYYAERDIHIKVGPNTYLYMENYNNNSDVGYKFTLETIEGTKVLQKLTAQRIEWQEEHQKWRLKRWNLHEFEGFQEKFTHGDDMDTTLRIQPRDFTSNYMLFEALTMDELDEKIEELKLRGADDIDIYKIEKYIRYMSPFTVIILTFIGLIVSARKARGGAGFQIALGFLIAFIFIVFFIFARRIAETGSVNQILAVWIPNIVFSMVGFLLYKTVPR
ncbi:MAG: LptF/LptG family permease [Cyclobacteriaceae bacterium]|nr:LptF/LptG family permease [Cyclobacteriaceae bacterium]